MAETIHNLDNCASFIEIGVWRGGTAAIIAKKLSILKANNLFYLADTFKGVVKASEKDFSYSGGEHDDTSIEIVKDLLEDKYNNLNIMVGIFPDETAHLISPNEKFGFCHIDVDVYESAKDIVDWIWNRLIPGGIIVFDDFGFSSCTGIIKYVNEQKKLNDRIVLHNLNGHAIMIKAK
jgi:O-methyltransferase